MVVSPARVLVVTQKLEVAHTLLWSLMPKGYEVTLVTTFAGAKAHLKTEPNLVIADVKLGFYNGIHVAIRAKAAGIPAIVIGPDDLVLRRDAMAIGAKYLTEEPDISAIISAVDGLLGEKGHGPWVAPAATPAQNQTTDLSETDGADNGITWAEANWAGTINQAPRSGRRPILH